MIFPTAIGMVANLATSNTHNPWAWAAIGMVLAVNIGLIAMLERIRPASSGRLHRSLALIATTAALLIVAVTVLIEPEATATSAAGPVYACTPVKASDFLPATTDDPDFGRWETGYACHNDEGIVHAFASAASLRVGLLRKGQPTSIFFCRVEVAGHGADRYWYRTAADIKYSGKGWGYVPGSTLNARHPVAGLPDCADVRHG